MSIEDWRRARHLYWKRRLKATRPYRHPLQLPRPQLRTDILRASFGPHGGVCPERDLAWTLGGLRLAKDRVTGRDVILAIGENMGQSLEPLVTKTIAPSHYQVYLHPDD